MNQLRSVLIAASLALCACKDKSPEPAGTPAAKPSSPAAGQPAPPAPPPAGTAARRTLALPGFAVDLELPSGWKEGAFGEGVMFTATGDSYPASMMFVTPGCQGNCATVAENVVGYVETQKKMHEESGYTVEVKAQAELAGGGRTFHLAVTRDGATFDQVVAIAHQPGWAHAVTCSATLHNEERARVETFAGWCRDMKITAAGTPPG